MMPVRVEWYDEAKTTVLYTIEGKWTWDELYPEYEKAIAMEKAQSHRVDVLIDMRECRYFPMNLLTHVQHISDKQPDNIGLSIIVSPNRFLNTLYDAGSRFHPNIKRYFVITSTMEQALSLLQQERAKE
jgi:hypothetical protein